MRKRACDAIFTAACGALQTVYEHSPLGISREMQEIDPVLTFKRNNLHQHVENRCKADRGSAAAETLP